MKHPDNSSFHPFRFTLSIAFVSAAMGLLGANTITVDASKVKCACAPDQWGIFFEDINLSADGGVYAELVRNRSFEDNGGKAPDAMKYWLAGGGAQLAVTDEKPHSKINAHSLKVVAPAGGSVANEGYFGMAVRPGVDYRLAVDLRGEPGRLSVALETSEGKAVSTRAEIEVKGGEWSTCSAQLQGIAQCGNARLVFRSEKGGTFFLDCVTLFPSDTYGKSGIFRKDLVEKLAALKPSFMRFPGGAWVESPTLDLSYRWKQTIGPIWERPTKWNFWGYWVSHGLGFHEYLLLCEELHTKPLFCINAGMAHKEIVPMEKMDEFVQDALDCIEYANGPVTSKWGAKRAENGHPAPFNLAYLQIGNEQGGKEYEKRYTLIANAVHAKYPEIKLVFDGGWSTREKDTWDIAAPKNLRDDHFYRDPGWFFNNYMVYTNTVERALGNRDFDVFIGEYASLAPRDRPYGTLRGAIGEAAFLLGLENCSDVVKLAAYAPLFASVNHLRWKPDLIYYSPSASFVNPGYDVQKLFSENRGRDVLVSTVASEPIEVAVDCRFGVGCWMGSAAFRDFKVVDAAGKVLYENSFANADSVKNWLSVGGGNWTVKNGELVQSVVTQEQKAMSLTLDRSWPDGATCKFKAKRLAGIEGFLAIYAKTSARNMGNWVNFGGWNNKEHGVEGLCAGTHVAGVVEKDRWYEVSVSFKDGTISASIDGAVVPTGGKPPRGADALKASAVTSPDGREIIVKVANCAERPIAADVIVANAKLAATAQLTTFTGPDANACNSLETPNALAPVTTPVKVADGKVQRVFPGLSFSVMRIPLK